MKQLIFLSILLLITSKLQTKINGRHPEPVYESTKIYGTDGSTYYTTSTKFHYYNTTIGDEWEVFFVQNIRSVNSLYGVIVLLKEDKPVKFLVTGGMPLVKKHKVKVEVDCDSIYIGYTDSNDILIRQRRKFKILHIGNSITRDSIGLVTFLNQLRDDIDFKIAFLDRGGSSIAYHCERFDNNKIDKSATYSELTNPGSIVWKTEKGKYTEKQMILKDTWDYITIQQQSDQADNYDSIVKDPTGHNYTIQGLIERIKRIIKNKVKFGYFDIPVKPTKYLPKEDIDTGEIDDAKMMESYNKHVDICKKLKQNYNIDFIIPIATAYVKAFHRGISKITCPEKPTWKVNWTIDGTHMRDGLPRLLEAYIVMMRYFDLVKIPYYIYHDKTNFTWDDLVKRNVMGRKVHDRKIYGLDDKNRNEIQEATYFTMKEWPL